MAFWNELPVVGGLAGAIFGNPEQEAHQKQMAAARQAMMAYRPQAMQSRMNAMGNMSHAFTPMNNLMGQMYGSGSQMDFGKTLANPFSQQMQEGMMEQAFTPEVNMPDKVGQLGAKVPKQIRDKVKAKQQEAYKQNRTKAGF